MEDENKSTLDEDISVKVVDSVFDLDISNSPKKSVDEKLPIDISKISLTDASKSINIHKEISIIDYVGSDKKRKSEKGFTKFIYIIK